jgi:hypothetical protein
MKRIIFSVAVCFIGYLGYAQVGIGNTDPKSSLDISASNVATPSNTDGILIPRIDDFPASDPGADQDGMLVFVTGNGTPAEGFYYWGQGTNGWVSVGASSSDADWYEVGTSNPADNISDNIYHLGNLAVGGNSTSTTSPLLVQGDVNTDLANILTSVNGAFPSGTYFGMSNSGSLTGAGNYTGMSNSLAGSNDGTIRGISNSILNSGTGQKIGIENSFNSADGVRKGFRNYFTTGNSISMGLENVAAGAFAITGALYGVKNDLSSDGAGQRYGVQTVINSTGNGAKYGEHILINSSAGGQHYGVYSDVQKASGYAGYFLGRLSLGTATTNRYLMPAADGAAGQVITTDGSGQLSFTTQANEWSDGGAYISPLDGTTKEVLIGTTTSSDGKLLVNGNGKNAAIETDLDGTNNYGIYNRRDSGVPALNYGVYNDIGGNNSTWSAWGTYNNITASGDGSRIGTYNRINSTGTGNKYCTWNYIPATDPGTHYGIRSDAQNASGYAAYFLGRTSLGNSTANRYIMPASDGSSGQVITTDGSGNLSFQAVPMDGTGTDDQTIDNFGLIGNTLGLSLEDDGQAVQTVDLSNVDFNVSNFGVAKMNMSANQALTIPTYTKVNFDTVAFDLGSNFNTSNDRFEVSETGVYRISATIHSFSAITPGPNVELLIYVSGSSVKRHISTHPTTGLIHRNVETIEYLNAGQYIEVYIYSSVNFTLNSGNDISTFEVERIR